LALTTATKTARDRYTRLTQSTAVYSYQGSSGGTVAMGYLAKAMHKFRARPGAYLLIPVVAAIVGWVTNWLAVQMIFYPIQYRGLSLYRRPELPLGFLGWQGIIPCKTRPMTEAMVNM